MRTWVLLLLAALVATARALPMRSVRSRTAQLSDSDETIIVADAATDEVEAEAEADEGEEESEEMELRFAETSAEASIDAMVHAESTVAMRQRASAALKLFQARTQARHQAHSYADQCVARSNRLRLEQTMWFRQKQLASASAGMRNGMTWDDTLHPYLCEHIVTYLKSVKGGQDVTGGTTDVAAVTAWLGPTVSPNAVTWRGRTKNNVPTNALDDGKAETEATKMMRTIRYRIGRNRATVCTTASMVRGSTAWERFKLAGKQTGYTVGLETEFHFVDVKPDVDKPNAVCRFALSAVDATWNLYYAMLSSDHSTQGHTIIEAIFSPLPLSPADDANTGNTYKSLKQMEVFSKNLADGVLTLGRASVTDKVGDFGVVQMTALAADLHTRNQGNGGGTVLPLGGHDNYKLSDAVQDPRTCSGVLTPGGSSQYRVRAVHRNLRGQAVDNDPAMVAAKYTQSNLMLPIAAFATDAFVAMTDTGLSIWRSSLEVCRAAARTYVRAHIAGLASLSATNRAEILGMFTAFYHHALFAMITGQYPDPTDLTGVRKLYYIDRTDWVPSSTEKNFFDVMIKTGLDKLLRMGNHEIVDELNEWWMSKNFGTFGDATDAHALLIPLSRGVCASTNDIVKKWCDAYWRTNKDGSFTYAKAIIEAYITNFDPVAYQPVPTSPTGSNPPAYISGAGANVDGHVLAVVEVRSPISAFTAAATASNAAGVNAVIKGLTGAIAWDGTDGHWPVAP